MDRDCVGEERLRRAQARVEVGGQVREEGRVGDHGPLFVRVCICLVEDALVDTEVAVDIVAVIEPAVAGVHEIGLVTGALVDLRQGVDRLADDAERGRVAGGDHIGLDAGEDIELRIGRARAKIADNDVAGPGPAGLRQHMEAVCRIFLLGVEEDVLVGEVGIRLAHDEDDIRADGGRFVNCVARRGKGLHVRAAVAVRLFHGIKIVIVQKTIGEAAEAEDLGDVRLAHLIAALVIKAGFLVHVRHGPAEAAEQHERARRADIPPGLSRADEMREDEAGGAAEHDGDEDGPVQVKRIFARGVHRLAQKLEIVGDEGVVAAVGLDQIDIRHQVDDQAAESCCCERVTRCAPAEQEHSADREAVEQKQHFIGPEHGKCFGKRAGLDGDDGERAQDARRRQHQNDARSLKLRACFCGSHNITP